jgi:hypothetical protein
LNAGLVFVTAQGIVKQTLAFDAAQVRICRDRFALLVT